MEQSLIYVQLPEKSPADIIKIIEDEIKDEEKHEAFAGMVNFRGETLRKIMKKIKS